MTKLIAANTAPWHCDTCRELITAPQDGMVVYLKAGGGPWIVHCAPHCCPNGHVECVAGWHLQALLDEDGLASLLQAAACKELPALNVLDVVMRLFVPGFERPRRGFTDRRSGQRCPRPGRTSRGKFVAEGTGPWSCDACGQPVATPEEGMVCWLKKSDLQPGLSQMRIGPWIVHRRARCYPTEPQGYCVTDWHLQVVLEKEGLFRLRGAISQNELPALGVFAVILRLYIPGFESHHSPAAGRGAADGDVGGMDRRSAARTAEPPPPSRVLRPRKAAAASWTVVDASACRPAGLS
jgi:hypothetical protein